MKTWRKVLFGLVLLASSVPYVVVSLFSGLMDLGYFLFIWAVFFLSRRLPAKVFTVVAVACGTAFAFPSSLFVVVDKFSDKF